LHIESEAQFPFGLQASKRLKQSYCFPVLFDKKMNV
jgi:hypothetical protein